MKRPVQAGGTQHEQRWGVRPIRDRCIGIGHDEIIAPRVEVAHSVAWYRHAREVASNNPPWQHGVAKDHCECPVLSSGCGVTGSDHPRQGGGSTGSCLDCRGGCRTLGRYDGAMGIRFGRLDHRRRGVCGLDMDCRVQNGRRAHRRVCDAAGPHRRGQQRNRGVRQRGEPWWCRLSADRRVEFGEASRCRDGCRRAERRRLLGRGAYAGHASLRPALLLRPAGRDRLQPGRPALLRRKTRPVTPISHIWPSPSA